MVLDFDRQTLVSGIVRRSPGHGPRLEYAVELEPKIVVQAARIVLLDHEPEAAGARHLHRSAGLGRLRKVAFLAVNSE